MAKKKKILFITHEASHTGAPILLLNLIRNIKRRNEYEISVLSVKNGPLVEDFKQFGEVGFIKPLDYRKEKTSLKKYFNKAVFTYRLLKNYPIWADSDIVFNNTVWNGKVLNFYSKLKKQPVVSYLHELANSIGSLENNTEAKYTFQNSSSLVSPSTYNAETLSSTYNIPSSKFTVLPYLMMNKAGFNQGEKEKARALLCEKYKIDPASKLVLGMGTFDLRKGTDYFIETANFLKDQPVHFFWIGQINDEALFRKMERYQKDNNISNFHYLGPFPHNLTNLYPYDMLFLSSREDPYPLVVLEAAMTKMPTVYFSGAGGIGAFVKDDAGWPVSNISPVDASNVIKNLTGTEIKHNGESAFNRVQDWHMNDDKIYNAFKAIITANLNED